MALIPGTYMKMEEPLSHLRISFINLSSLMSPGRSLSEDCLYQVGLSAWYVRGTLSIKFIDVGSPLWVALLPSQES